MMDTTHVTKKLPLWAGGDLARPEMDRIQAHLDVCPACRAEAESYVEAMSWLRQPPDPPFTQGERVALRKETMEKIRMANSRPRKGALPWLLLAAALPVGILLYRALEKPPGGASAPLIAHSQANGGTVVRASGELPLPGTEQTTAQQPQQSAGNQAPGVPSVPGASGSHPVAHRATAQPAASARPAPPLQPAHQERDSTVTRIEIQTENPRVKIIWFARSGTQQSSSDNTGA